MKVPEYIKKEIFSCADYYNRARDSEQIIRKWLEKNHLTEDTTNKLDRWMDDAFMDNCLITYAPSNFIEKLEKI